MKKTVILLAVAGVVVVCSGAVLVDQTIELKDNGGLATEENGIHAHAHGFVTVRTTRGQTVAVAVQLYDAAPTYTYVVKSAGKVLGTFTTDAKGNGGLQVCVQEKTLGAYVNVWETCGVYQTDQKYLLLYGQR